MDRKRRADNSPLRRNEAGFTQGFTARKWNAFTPLGSGRCGAGVNTVDPRTAGKDSDSTRADSANCPRRGNWTSSPRHQDGGSLSTTCAIVWHQHRKTRNNFAADFDYAGVLRVRRKYD